MRVSTISTIYNSQGTIVASMFNKDMIKYDIGVSEMEIELLREYSQLKNVSANNTVK